ncbi:ZIP family metal transporter [Cyclobacterium plantarum]|uniref:ZIP family metal transporter n=1 Tax=Cyclobacterium plantarum TaxID=2716263 RepID=A0ABX0HET1_9BACT|nr:ZIP family metal transporter [Cyclobacterium plantarum]NHE59042.1 ZIP family metal transporter [Cyclobacterium plantarum]
MVHFILLFVAALGASLLALIIPEWKEKSFKLGLIFAGAYLFAITILHILPELFADQQSAYYMGLYILLGFLLQQVLDVMSSGIEHGHIHDHSGHGMGNSVWTLMIGLFLHAFLEGTLLSKQPMLAGHHHGSETLLIGMILHKMPEAFALVAVLMTRMNKPGVLSLLVLFALASPLGMISTDFLFDQQLIGRGTLNILFGLVAGGFLHISTIIFFESSPQHRFNLHKLLIILLASGIAILTEFII